MHSYGDIHEEFATLINTVQDFYGVCDTMFKLGDFEYTPRTGEGSNPCLR